MPAAHPPQREQQHHAVVTPTPASQQQQAAAFPLKEALLTAGVLSVVGMFYFHRKKQTVPFKTCYGLMWPTLGVGTILAVTPDKATMTERLEHSRAVTPEDLRRQREANAATIETMMKQYAHKQS